MCTQNSATFTPGDGWLGLLSGIPSVYTSTVSISTIHHRVHVALLADTSSAPFSGKPEKFCCQPETRISPSEMSTELDWTWIGSDPDCNKFFGIWIGSGMQIASKI